MGSQHVVETLSALRIPSGRQMTAGAFIRERTATDDIYDQPGDWAKALNTFYEILRPPVVRDAPQTPFVSSGADTYQTLARYRVNLEHARTGLGLPNNESLKMRAYVSMLGGDTGRIQLVTPDQTRQTPTFTSATPVWVETSALADILDIGGGSVEITVEGKATTDGANLQVHAIEISWSDERTTLPNGDGGPYTNGFAPMSENFAGDLHGGICTEQIRRLMKNARLLKSTRTPGIITTGYLPTATGDTRQAGSNTTNLLWHAVAYQYEFVRSAEVWLYMKGSTTPAIENDVTVQIGESQYTITGVPSGAHAWYQVVLTLPVHRSGRPRRHRLTVRADSDTLFELYGCTAFWQPTGSLVR